MRTWAYGLTADEWLHLACEGDESEVAPCCGNIGGIRETIWALMTQQGSGQGWARRALGRQLAELVEADGDGHGLPDRQTFPLLHKVLDGVAAEAAT